jgi:hypothetical protein
MKRHYPNSLTSSVILVLEKLSQDQEVWIPIQSILKAMEPSRPITTIDSVLGRLICLGYVERKKIGSNSFSYKLLGGSAHRFLRDQTTAFLHHVYKGDVQRLLDCLQPQF